MTGVKATAAVEIEKKRGCELVASSTPSLDAPQREADGVGVARGEEIEFNGEESED
jgi:hypothetical protein